MERALILSRGERLHFPDLARDDPAPRRAVVKATDGPMRTMDEAIADHIRDVLRRTGGKVGGRGGAAEFLQ